jgi:hypothetical protein
LNITKFYYSLHLILYDIRISYFFNLHALDLAAATLCLRCLILFPGLKHIVQEYRINDMRRPTQDTQFHNDKRQLIGEKDTRRKSCHGKEMGRIGEWQWRQFFQTFRVGKRKRYLPSVVQNAQGRIGHVKHVTVRDQSEIRKHLSHWHGKYGTVIIGFWVRLGVWSVSIGIGTIDGEKRV